MAGEVGAVAVTTWRDVLAYEALHHALLEWRDARAAFLRCVDTAPHEDQALPSDVGRRFADAEAKLFEVAEGMGPAPHVIGVAK